MTQQRGIEPIVLVEDDPNDVYFVRRALQNAHITNPLLVFETVDQARQGIGGPQLLVHNPVLLILDLFLPGGEGGLDLLRWLRRLPPPVAATPAIILTASDRAEDREESSLLGSMLYLKKPVTESTLSNAAQALGFVIVSSFAQDQIGFRIIQRRPG